MAAFDCCKQYAAALSTALQVEPCVNSVGLAHWLQGSRVLSHALVLTKWQMCTLPARDCWRVPRAGPISRGLRSSAALQELADMSTFNPAYGSRTPTYAPGPDGPASLGTTPPLNGPGMDPATDGHLVVSQPVMMLLRGQSTAMQHGRVSLLRLADLVTASESLCCGIAC